MDPREALKTYTGKRHMYMVRRGNKAIKEALKYAKAQGKTRVLIPAEGGWITYEQYPAELKMRCKKIRCRNARLDLNYLKEALGPDAVLLVNSMPAYSTYEQMELIAPICERYQTLLINDATGSIGTVHARFGDLIVGSFGERKPIELGTGGFLALDDAIIVEEAELDELALAKAIKTRPQRCKAWQADVKKIKKDLRHLGVVHPESEGYVAIIKYKSEAEKHQVTQYCADHGWWYTECPRYIRLEQPAISIEVKHGKT